MNDNDGEGKEMASAYINYEASVCSRSVCGASVIHKLKGAPKLLDGDLCPRCDQPTMEVIRNPSVVASIVYATQGRKEI
jgi:hypothetical protein